MLHSHSLKRTSLLVTAAFGTVFLALPARADAPPATTSVVHQSRVSLDGYSVAGNLKTPGKRAKVQCNGKTTSECCSGLSFCGCLYMPGSSSDNHPTSCHSNPPPSKG